MLKAYPSFFWTASQFIQPLFAFRNDSSIELKMELITRCNIGLNMLLEQKMFHFFLPVSATKAESFLFIINRWMKALSTGIGVAECGDASALQKTLNGFSVSLQDELDRLPTFTVTAKGNLSIDNLVEGASKGYPKAVLELADGFIKDEIDHAGKCLAFELPTSCGFHILRAVEIGIKAYVLAAAGSLPKINSRNWGQYITLLENAGSNVDLIDVLRILKTKRNPLMHPQDNLQTDEAISLFCICQAGLEALVADVRNRSLETKFKDALAKLPSM
jgi:hypothetical protein